MIKMSAKKKAKTKKYLPDYAAMCGVIFVMIILLTIIVCNIAGCGNSENNTETTPSAETAPETNAPVIDKNWALYVVGNDNPLPEDFSIETKLVSNGHQLDVRCANYAIRMFKDAEEQNVGLYLSSAYRSIQKQQEALESYINTLMSNGYTKEQAAELAKKEIAAPGCSEHNTGLAMDIVSDTYWNTHSDLEQSFDRLPQFNWLIKNSWKYGFILSYPKDKEDVTGFIYEPWHFRFVGLEHSCKIHKIYEETGEFITLNEYIEQYME